MILARTLRYIKHGFENHENVLVIFFITLNESQSLIIRKDY